MSDAAESSVGTSGLRVSNTCFGVSIDDVSYEVQWSPRSKMSWGQWLKTACTAVPRQRKVVFSGVSGYVKPGELYVVVHT